MKFTPQSPLVMLCLIFTVITLFSCSKDSDLLADYVALDPDIGTIAKFVKNDSYQISISNNPEDDTIEIVVNNGSVETDTSGSSGTGASGSNGTTVNDSYQISSNAVSIILDVLANDTFETGTEVVITETSAPINGTVVINNDETLTYTPNAEIIEQVLNTTNTSTVEVLDTFTYTVEVVNKDGSVTSEVASVEIAPEDNSSRQFSNISPFEYCQDGNPIGGGAGYDAILTTGTHIVSTNINASAFKTLVEARTSGHIVFINNGVTIDLTGLGSTIDIPAGVTIASDRGSGSNIGALIKTDDMAYLDSGSAIPAFKVIGENVRFTGIRFQGPYGEVGNYSSTDDSVRRAKWGISTHYDNTEIDNCELYNWPSAAVVLSRYSGTVGVFGPNKWSERHLVHHNYIHNNRQNSFGYGIDIQFADATIYSNIFEENRHDIAGRGEVGPNYTGYEAYCNTVKAGGSHHNFDMHGQDKGGTGKVGGKYIYIHHNDFEDIGLARSGVNNEDNIRISGQPEDNVTVIYNRFAHPNISIAYEIRNVDGPVNEVINNNIFNGD